MIPSTIKFLFIIFYTKLVSVSQINSYSFECNDHCDKVNNLNYPMGCFCTDCEFFSDCCHDRPSPREKNHLKCSSKISDDSFIYSVDSCPEEFLTNKYSEKFIKEKCESDNETYMPLILPIYSTEDELIYKNIYCAKCNFKNLTKTKMFTINLKNNFYESVFDKAFIDELLKGNKPESYDYKLQFDPPANAKIRACKKTVDSCPSNYTNTEISNLCQKSTAYRYALEGLSYKNEYCAICNSLNVNMLQCAKRIDYNTFVNSLQILFDLSDLNDDPDNVVSIWRYDQQLIENQLNQVVLSA